MIVRLRDTGHLEDVRAEGESPYSGKSFIERPALLVYEGSFMSMDGAVDVSRDQLERLVSNHNSWLGKAKRLAKGEVPIRLAPPLQLDHSTSSRDTIGKVPGELRIGEYELENGEKVAGVFTDKVRVLGEENVRKVEDGRWSRLSVGADFDKGKFSELSITPFPAAEDAALMREGEQMDKELKARLVAYLERKNKLSAEHAETLLKGLSKDQVKHLQEQESKDKEEEEKRMAEEKDAMKKHLMEEEKLSEEDAEEKLGGMTDDEKAELRKKCASKLSNAEEGPDNAKTDPGKDLDPATEAPIGEAKMKRLVSDFRANSQGAKLLLAKMRIRTKLSKLRASAKITPAEIKKIDVDKLAAESEATQLAVLKSYEDREDVIPVGVLGTKSGENIAEVERLARLSALENETRSNMKSVPQTGSRMSNADEAPDSVTLAGDMDKDYERMCSLIDGDEKEEAKKHLKSFMSAIRAGRYSGLQSDAEEEEKQLSALAEQLIKLEDINEDLTKLVGEK